MTISKTFARAPCPLFAGRGLKYEGFTMELPYKTYLTAHPTNIAAERSFLTVFNYDMAEYVYNNAADAYGFGVYIETGGFTDAITDGKHMYAAKFFLKLSEDYSLGSGERHNCDVRGIAVGVEVAYDLSGVAHGAYIGVQFKEASDATTIGGYYLSHTPTYGVIGLEVRTEAKDGGDGGIVVGAAAYGCVGLFVAQKNDAAWTGNYAAIVLHVPYEGSDTIVGTTYGIRFDTGGIWAGTDFDYGIDFGDQCVIGIDIGAVTTGITFTGTVTTIAISMAASVTCPVFMALGTWGNDINWDQAQEFIEVLVETTSTSASKPMARFRLAGHASTAHTGELCSVQIQTYQAASNVTDMIGLKVESGWKANGTLLSGGTYGWIGLLVRLEDLDFTMTGTGNAYVAELRTQMFDPASAFNAESSFLHILNLNDAAAAIDSVFYLEQAAGQAGVATYLIDMDATVVPWNDTTKALAIRVVSTVYNIPTGTGTSGINLGTIATGITFGTHSTTAIVVPASTVMPEFINIGSWGSEVQWDGLDEFIDILVETTLVTVGKPLMRIRLEADNDADMTTGALETFELICANATTYDSYSMMALNCKTQFKGTMEALTGGITMGASIGISGLDNIVTVTGDIYGLEITMDGFASGSAFSGQSAFLYLHQTTGLVSPESLIRFKNSMSGSDDTEYFIDIEKDDGGVCKPFTTDSVATNSAGSQGCLKCIIGGTVYEIPLFTV